MKNVLLFRQEWHEAIVKLDSINDIPASYEALLKVILDYAFGEPKLNLDECIDVFGKEAGIVLDLIFAQIDRDRRED